MENLNFSKSPNVAFFRMRLKWFFFLKSSFYLIYKVFYKNSEIQIIFKDGKIGRYDEKTVA